MNLHELLHSYMKTSNHKMYNFSYKSYSKKVILVIFYSKHAIYNRKD